MYLMNNIIYNCHNRLIYHNTILLKKVIYMYVTCLHINIRVSIDPIIFTKIFSIEKLLLNYILILHKLLNKIH